MVLMTVKEREMQKCVTQRAGGERENKKTAKIDGKLVVD